MISTTSKEPFETEIVTVTSVSDDGLTISFSPALQYQHLG